MADLDADTTITPSSFYDSVDTRRNDGLNNTHTSLNVLNVKKNHRTQVQKQLHQFNKQQMARQSQMQGQMLQNSVHARHMNNDSRSTMSIQSRSPQSSRHQSSFSFAPPPPQSNMYAQPHQSSSNTSFNSNSSINKQSYQALHGQHPPQPGFRYNHHQGSSGSVLPQGQWFSGNHHASIDELDTFDNKSFGSSFNMATPDLNLGEWGSVSSGDVGTPNSQKMRELQEDNLLLMEEVKKFQEFRELNEVLIEENEILREKTKIMKESQKYQSPMVDRDDELNLKQNTDKLQREKDELVALNEEQKETINTLQQDHENLKLTIESMTQEITKLKLINMESEKEKTEQIESLKEQNDELTKELEVFYGKDQQSALTSLNSTPHSSPTGEGLESRESISIKPTDLNTTPQSTPPQTNQKQFQAINHAHCNEELVSDLLITIRQLKSDNEVLIRQKEIVVNSLAKQKKFVKKMVENGGTSGRMKIKGRRGLGLVECVEMLI